MFGAESHFSEYPQGASIYENGGPRSARAGGLLTINPEQPPTYCLWGHGVPSNHRRATDHVSHNRVLASTTLTFWRGTRAAEVQ